MGKMCEFNIGEMTYSYEVPSVKELETYRRVRRMRSIESVLYEFQHVCETDGIEPPSLTEVEQAAIRLEENEDNDDDWVYLLWNALDHAIREWRNK